jgi:hypothetical protein
MQSTVREEMPWLPTTEAERATVLREMERLLQSHLFRHSKRYPALFQHIVLQTLAGNTDSLKERLLGIAVFHRSPDYDANADPIVRVTAGEIRKRIAQFYHEDGPPDGVYIELRPGSYVPSFHPVQRPRSYPREPVAARLEPPAAGPAHIPSTRLASSLRLAGRFPRQAIALAALIVASLMGAVLLFGFSRQSEDERSQFWYPMLQAPGPVLVVVGQPHAGALGASGPGSVYEHTPGGELELADAIAMAHLSNVLDAQHRPYQITAVSATSLSDLRKGPTIMVGGFNNPWTLRVLEPLRFSLRSAGQAGSGNTNDTANSELVEILDRKNLSASSWKVDFRHPISEINHDYAIIARFHATMTDGEVMVIAGLGAGATESASKFVSSAAYMNQIARSAPAHWRNMNMEAVLETEVIGGRSGHARIVATEFW